MAAAWALALALGGWVAPTFAASGNPENQDPRDETASSAKQTAYRYLRYGSDLDLERAEAELCEGASPEVTPSDLDAIRQSYDEELGGITRIDPATDDPVEGADGFTVAGTVSYVSDASPRYEEFVVTVQEQGDGYCVSDAVQVQENEPGSGDGTGDEADPQALATEFLRSIVVDRLPAVASELQCSSYTGPTPEELDLAITEWGATTAFLNGIEQAESTETSVTAFSVEVSLKGDLDQESYAFVVGVQGDCVASLAGGDGLI
jgi:hypothetical protein